MTSDYESLAAREAARVIQPPAGGTGDVWADIIAHIKPGPLQEACISRREFGLKKHGRPLRYGDGRGNVDALQELLDFVAYSWRDGDTDGACIGLSLVERALGRLLDQKRWSP
jgi:hypothetical protein